MTKTKKVEGFFCFVLFCYLFFLEGGDVYAFFFFKSRDLKKIVFNSFGRICSSAALTGTHIYSFLPESFLFQ